MNCYSVVPTSFSSNFLIAPGSSGTINITDTNCATSDTWDNSIALNTIDAVNVMNLDDTIFISNPSPITANYIDVSVVGNTGAIANHAHVPYKLTAFNIFKNINAVINLNDTFTIGATYYGTTLSGNYTIVNSDIINESSNVMFSSFGSITTDTITFDENVKRQISGKYVLLYFTYSSEPKRYHTIFLKMPELSIFHVLTIHTPHYIKQKNSNTTTWQYSTDNITYTDIQDYPVHIKGSGTVSVVTDLYIDSEYHNFRLFSNILLDFENHNIFTTENIATTVKPLIYSETNSTNIIVKNLNYKGNKLLEIGDAYVFGQYFGDEGNTFTIENINNYTNIGSTSVSNCGGIFSQYSVGKSTNILVKNCKNFGSVVSDHSGGIFSSSCFLTDCTMIGIENCFSSGDIIGNNSGGIFGHNCFYDYKPKGKISVSNKLATIYKCYNNGNIIGNFSGGIFASNNFRINLNDPGEESDGLIISNCYNTGNIEGNGAGGIGGFTFIQVLNKVLTEKEKVTIQYCYNTGNVTGENAGGIFGKNFFDSYSFFNTINVEHCYNTGTLNSATQGGFMGYHDYAEFDDNTYNFTNCYSLATPGFTANAIFVPYNRIERITNLNNTFTTNNTWNYTNALYSLGGTSGVAVNALSNNYNSFTFSGSYTDVSVVNSSNEINSFIPFKLTSFNENIGTTFTNITPGSNITVDPNTGGTYYIVTSNITNSSNNTLYSAFGSINSSTSVITTNSNVATQSGKTFLVYQTGAIQNGSTAFHETYNIMYFPISFLTISSESGNTPIICMGEDTLITIFENNIEIDKPIKNLKVGELVKTENNQYIPIKHIYQSYVYNTKNPDGKRKKDKFYLLTKEKFPELKQDLYLTGGHPILVDELSEQELKRQSNFYMKNADKNVGDKKVLLTFFSDNVLDFEENQVFPIYNIVLENVNGVDRHQIRINGLLSSSMSFEKYSKYILVNIN